MKTEEDIIEIDLVRKELTVVVLHAISKFKSKYTMKERKPTKKDIIFVLSQIITKKSQ